MHCTDAACVKVCPSGALYYSELGTVGIVKERCIGCKECVAACPFEIPRYDSVRPTRFTNATSVSPGSGPIFLPPASRPARPGALTFGDKDDDGEKGLWPGEGTGRRRQCLRRPSSSTGRTCSTSLRRRRRSTTSCRRTRGCRLSVIVWKDLLKPLSLVAAGGVLAASFLHYIIHGPKTPDEEDNQKTEGGA